MYENDPRHATNVIAALGLEDSKPVATPRVKPASSENEERGQPLTPKEAT